MLHIVYKLISLSLTGMYPASPPQIDLPSHLQSLGLREHILSAIPEGAEGTPVLYQLIDAAREWVSTHPMNIKPQQLKPPQPSESSSADERKDQPVCRFFLQGKCRFGDKCKNSHTTTSQLKTQRPAYADDGVEKPVGTGGKKPKQKPSMEGAGGSKMEKKAPMRTSEAVISRILWDPDLPSEEFKVGYLDRFVGIVEKPFSSFSWEDLATVGNNVLAVPKHRIQYFKFREEIVWDKRSQLDNFFGSRGGRMIQDIVAEQWVSPKEQNEKDGCDATESSTEECKVKGELTETDIEVDVLEDENSSCLHADRNRPTHFVCIHITNPKVKDNVARVQSHITGHTPQLAEGCLPVTALHVTLCMVRLENENQISIAQDVMKNARPQFIHILPRCLHLSFTGVGNFRERLVYVKVAPSPALDKFVFFLIERFREAGLRTPGNHEEYTPHMTVVKLSRPMQRELHTGIISPASYQPFLDVDLGSNQIESLSLCSMTAPKQSDGFYLRLSEISNSLAGLPTHFLSLVSKRLDFFCTGGVITESERDELHKTLQVASGQGSMREFDITIEEIIRLGSEETMCSKTTTPSPVLIALRGVPGSGKSYLATHCSEYLKNPSKVAICSADQFFIESGEYKFSPKLLPKGHTHCLGLFLQALEEGKELVIVDNTNSKKWEYCIYKYICSILGCKFYVLEIPCPSVKTLETYRSRNQHNVDPNAALKIFQRWEVDEKASIVPPPLAYPRMTSTSLPDYSLVSLCLADGTEIQQALHDLAAIKVVYTAIFLTTESQWKLVTSLMPTHPRISAEHVTLVFEPGKQSCLANIGRRVTVHVTGSADNGKVQVATVELPHGVTSQNSHPHITVSTEENVPPKMANEMLQRQSVKSFHCPLQLEGVIGVMVRERNELDDDMKACKENASRKKIDFGNQPTFAVKSETHFQLHVLPKLVASFDDIEDTSIHICTGKQKITNLYIFDFDGTLFNTPDPKKGREIYENYTGTRWERKGWLSWPESLLPPMKTYPGPALPIYREHIGQSGSLTIILTGRIERTMPGITQVLENFKVYPDQLFMKPDKLDETTPSFKARIVQKMLETYSDVTLVKVWDDLPGNLAAMHRLSKSAHKHVKFVIIDATQMLPTTASKHGKKLTIQSPLSTPGLQSEPFSSMLEAYLASCGHLPSRAYNTAAEFGVRFIAEQFCKMLGYWGDPMHLVYPFGSFPLCRKGDVDICLLSPPHFTPTDCLEQLWRQLGECGINYLHKGYSTRCPRLMVMLEFPTCPPIDYDIVFASINDLTVFETPLTTQLPAPDVVALLKPEDTASKAALTGPVFLHKLFEKIEGIMQKSKFGAVVEMIVQIFSAQRQKGNAYHCIRTFHIVRLLADFINTHGKNLKTTNCDLFLKEFFNHAVKISNEQWKKLFGEFVPSEFIPKVKTVLEFAAREMSLEREPCYEELMDRSTPYPPEGYTTVELSLSGTNTIALWKLHAIVQARLPSCIRQLIASGLDVLPDGNIENKQKFVFAVPHTKAAKQTLQQVFRPFWKEIADFRKESGVNINLNFGQMPASTSTSSSQAASEKQTSPAIESITKFASDPDQSELHITSQLKSYERMLVYETCEQLGLSHRTVVSGKEKHIVVKK